MPVHQSVRPSLIFWAILGVAVLGGGLAYWVGAEVGPLSYLAVFVLVIAGWVVSLCLHEFGHAFTAWRFGDQDIALRGYLDLDPRRYISPVWSILIPILITAIGGIGLPGAAVYVRTAYMTAKQRTLVSLAGPAANLVLAVALLEAATLFFDPMHPVFWAGIAFLGFLQITALLLNLLPIPGLDGYNALEPHLSPETQRALAQFKPYGFLLLFVLLLAPPLNQLFFGLVDDVFELSGLSGSAWRLGAWLMQFWRH
ncbi:site-2 protease family protein [Candidatus Mycobacterium wuenschmannii]|uniref:Site-2 protease family protein n=1 Tax=Candidatus Mycobacterium wuenschmannii TaxID=3027808 RepID=A0ABY8W7J0_9MYCO|nr:site-2 protease family protein [Candidatus Mycobacterium wuenschmannii]WIM90427.1 site-2 protease family protein [Candidatus Mycobacterium wuenschmannii]